MNIVARLLRDTFERLTARFYEGPEPPPRLRDEVLMFRLMQPNASVAAWVEFAIGLAEQSYRSGFTRGFAWHERSLAEQRPDSPERIADAEANAWSLADNNPELRAALDSGVDPNDPLAGVPPEARAAFFDQLGIYWGTHRVVVLPEDEKK